MTSRSVRLTLIAILASAALQADVRVRLNVHAGHPIRRPAPTVVVRAPRRPVVVAPAVRFAPVIAYRPSVVVLPARNLMVWEDRETIRRREQWVDMNFNVDNNGRSLFFNLGGRAQVNFAEVHYGNGEVQVVDFNDGAIGGGTYLLLDIRDGRRVNFVRMVARSQTPQAEFTLYMAR